MVQVEGLDVLMKEHPFFEGMDDDMRAFVAGCAANERFDAGAYLFHEGDDADKIYLIRHGSVAIEVHVPSREPIVVETLGEGEVVGWSWMLPPYKRSFDARAVSLIRAVSLDATCLRKKMDEDHSVGYQMYKRFAPVMADRLAAARLQMIDMYGHPGDRR